MWRVTPFQSNSMRKKDRPPNFVKHLQITIDLNTQTALIEVIQRKRTLKKSTVDIYALPDMLNTETNCITIENINYYIGHNTIQSIYPKEKQAAWLEYPAMLPRSITKVEKIREIVEGIRLSIQAEQKARQWEKSNYKP